jgi:acetolactate synthase-1/3 small subunit
VAGLFARRGYNIESLVVSTTERADISRMTIVVGGEESVIEQVVKQLNKLIEVIKVWDITDAALVRELALVKVRATQETRPRILQIAEVYRARVVDLTPAALTLEITGGAGKVDALEQMLQEFGILEIARTGQLALERGGRGRMDLGE